MTFNSFFAPVCRLFALALLVAGSVATFAAPVSAAPLLLQSVSCDTPVYAGYEFEVTVTLSVPAVGEHVFVKISASDPDLVPWGSDGPRTMSFEPGWQTQTGPWQTNDVAGENSLTLTFQLYNGATPTLLDTKSCVVQLTHTLVPEPPHATLQPVTCDESVNAGSNFNYRLEVTPLLGGEWVLLTPSSLDLVPWGSEGGGTRSVSFESGPVWNGYVPTSPVSEDAVLTMTFELKTVRGPQPAGSAQCQVQVIGTHDPTAVPGSPTPTATATVPPGSLVRSIHTQTGSRSGGSTKVTVCLFQVALSGGTVVEMGSDRPDVIDPGAQIVIPEGHACLSSIFPVAMVGSPATVTLSAGIDDIRLSSSTLVRATRPWISAQTVSRAGGLSKITICQVDKVGSGGLTSIGLASDQPTPFPVPASITIASGSACASLVISVGNVVADTPVTITATFGDVVRTDTTVIRNLSDLQGADDPNPTTGAATNTPVVVDTGTPGPSVTPTSESVPASPIAGS